MKNDISRSDSESGKINIFYQVCGIIISLCAIAEFIIWICDASKLHFNNQVILGSGLLSVSVGALLYLLFRNKSYKAANVILWVTIIAAIVLFFVGIAVTPEAGVLGAVN